MMVLARLFFKRPRFGLLVIASLLVLIFPMASGAEQTLFGNQTPPNLNATDNKPLELGLKFQADVPGVITAIRHYKARSEPSAFQRVGKIWDADGKLLDPPVEVAFESETESGWQQQALPTPLEIDPDTTYVVSVNIASHFPISEQGALSSPVVSGNLRTVADGNNGVFGPPGEFPTSGLKEFNYFRDVVFVADTMSLNLPPYPVVAEHSDWLANGNSNSAYDVTLFCVGEGFDITDSPPLYNGWCVEDNGRPNIPAPDPIECNQGNVILWSTYDPNLPDNLATYQDPAIPLVADGTVNLGDAVPWDKVNYLLNNKGDGNKCDVQAAIFLVVWGTANSLRDECVLTDWSLATAEAIAADAEANGAGFVPGLCDITAILLDTGDGLGLGEKVWQDSIIELPPRLAKIGDFVWEDCDQNGLQDDGDDPNCPGGGGIPDVKVQLFEPGPDGQCGTDDDPQLPLATTFTGPDGDYLFEDLSPGDYCVKFPANPAMALVDCPPGFVARYTTRNAGDDPAVDSNADENGVTDVTSLPECEEDLTVDAGLFCEEQIQPDCGLKITKNCEVVAPPPEPFVCDDKIDAITMVLDEDSGLGDVVSVTAHLGDTSKETLPADNVNIIGNEVTVTGYQVLDAPNDVVWVFVTTNGGGQSEFHLSCSDDEMDGETDDPDFPQDCGRPQGNGKDNSSGDNVWRLEEMATDKGFVLDCTPPESPPTAECTFEAQFASCESLPSDPDILTFRYTGGGCEATDNFQKPDDVSCTGAIDPTLPVTLIDADKQTYVVEPGGTFDVPRDDADKLTLTNNGGTEALELHTSCSQPLQTGDVYGSLTLVALDGVGLGTDVLYSYLVENQGPATITDISVVDDPLGEIAGSPIASLLSGDDTTLEASAFILETTTNTVTATGTGAPGADCTATSETTVTVTPPAPCSVSVAFDKIEDDKVKYELTNTGLPVVRMETLVLNFDPGYVAIKEVKLDGTVYKLSDSNFGLVASGDIIGDSVPPAKAVWTNPDSTKRQLDPGETRTLEIVFTNKQDKELFTPDDFSGTVTFNDLECFLGL